MSNTLKLLLFVSLAFLAECTFAQTAPSVVEHPDIKVGDSWTYQLTNDWRSVVKDTYTFMVSAVSDKEIQLTRKSEKTGATVTVAETPDLNALVKADPDGSIVRYSPNNGAYSFPLNVGKTWEAKADWTTDGRSGSYSLATKVVGWEQVTVPAGTFTALKITKAGYYRATNGQNSGSGKIHMTLWYAPAVKGMVEMQYEDTNWSGTPYNKETTRLMAYKVN